GIPPAPARRRRWAPASCSAKQESASHAWRARQSPWRGRLACPWLGCRRSTAWADVWGEVVVVNHPSGVVRDVARRGMLDLVTARANFVAMLLVVLVGTAWPLVVHAAGPATSAPELLPVNPMTGAIDMQRGGIDAKVAFERADIAL